MTMSAGRGLQHVFLPAIIAMNFISFAQYIDAQRCQMAHDKSALKVLRDSAAAGDTNAQCGMGRQYEYALGVPLDYKQSLVWLLKSAEQGDITAQVELGVVYDKMQDYAQAFTWYSKAAEQGNARAEYNIGLAYQNGESVPKDMAQAIAWYRKAADQGDVIAQNNLAVIYDQGLGVPQDYLQAADWYRKAAEKGFAEAQYGLGFLYLNGYGVPKDINQATTWMLKAAEQGETHAQYDLGVSYVNGDGVSRDLNEGYFWIFLADTLTTDSGLKQYTENSLREDAKVMKKSDIKNAQKRAQSWLNEHPPKPEQ
jgi:TPR repeat protein